MSNHVVVPPEQLAPNQPTIPVESVGEGWRRVSIGEPIKSSYQAFTFAPGARKPEWRLSSFYSAEGEKVTGRTHYRAPASVRAWLSVLPRLAIKLARGYWRYVWDGRFV